ncbi:glycosyltransferase [Streptomyces swartbergensis]|uniref:glycosyltransferase n=1 Tax=Streptomyces swartbergensis TaxID=487165 RepID=UPI000A3B9884|nr:glycosyltransferase [Streptomyces swartbergensis]
MTATSQRLLVPGDAPIRVVDIDLAEPGRFSPPGSRARIHPQGRVLALVRRRGHPLGMVLSSGASPAELWQTLAESTRRELDVCMAPSDAGRTGDPPDISVVVPTRNRCDQLRQCLDSLLRMEYPRSRFEITVVDNAPANAAAEQLVHEAYSHQVRYVREPVAGGARARNRGLAAAHGTIVAYSDDDTLVDARWLSALAEAFSGDRHIGCVTGLIVPAELQTEAQAALERHGAFGKGYRPRSWSLHDPPEDPLFPFTAGHFGSGANMAFRTDLLRALGGFDPATGPGTPARGGEDLLAFFQVVVSGRTLAYQPDAIVWHRHRRTADALSAQAFGYGAGFGAYLTGALAHHPRMLPALLRRLPGGIRYAAARAHMRTSSQDTEWSRRLALLEIRGLLYGPVGYLRSRSQCLR